ncbi:lipopolysaccharide biosynthesis protein [Colwelliaceae bacterium 6471]
MVDSHSFAHAYKWSLIQKWIIRFLGLISTLILVRLLSPEDFGIVALASLVIGFFDVLGSSGQIKYIIKKQEVTSEDLNCAWTLNLLIRCALTVVIFFSASLFANYLDEPKLTMVLQATCLILVIDSFKNIGLALDLKKMNFKSSTQISIAAKLISFVVTISCAFYLKSYWALIIGTITFKLCEVVGSYILHPYRPQLSLTKIAEQWLFSKWIFLTSISGFMRAKLDILLVGANIGIKETGLYSIAQEFSVLAQTEIIEPAMQPLYSVYSTIINVKEKLEEKVHQTIYLTYAFLIPCCFGVSILSEQITYVVLGEKWSDASGLMQLLPFLMLNFLTYGLFLTLSELKGKMKVSLIIDLIGMLMFIAVIYSSTNLTINDFALYRVSVAVIIYCLTLFCFNKILGISIKPIVLALVLPSICSAIMYLAISNSIEIFSNNNLINLMINIAIGFIVYSSCYVLAIVIFRKKSQILTYQHGVIMSLINRMKK